MYNAEDFLDNLDTTITYAMRKAYNEDWSETEEVFVPYIFDSMSYIVKAIDKTSTYCEDLKLKIDELDELLNPEIILWEDKMKIETVRDLMKYLMEFNPNAKLTNDISISWKGKDSTDKKGKRDILKEMKDTESITIEDLGNKDN